VSAPIFISYSSTDQKVAESICLALESRGQKCWISCRDIGPGENFQESIVKAIRSARVMLLVFTSNANNSNEIKKELVLAGRHHVTVVPVRVEDVVPNDALAYEFATRQWIDLFKDWEREIERLASQIRSILASAVPGRDASVQAAARPIAQTPITPKSPLRSIAVIAALVIVALGIGGAYWYTRPVAPPAASAPPAAAQSASDENAWLDAAKSGTVQALRQYLDRFSDGIHTADARQRIQAADDNAFANASAIGTAVALIQYVEQFPSGAHIAQARTNIADLNRKASDENAWLDALNAGTIVSFNDYLKSFSSGAHATQAQRRIADLGKAPALQPAKPVAGGSFDGLWVTTISCPAAAGALGVSFQFDSQVKNGIFHGSRGVEGKPGWLTLDGKILSDGAVDIYAKGIVNSSAFAAGNVPTGTDYGYHVAGRLAGTSGTGNRVEGRPCTLTFVKK
jgi:TIR domain